MLKRKEGAMEPKDNWWCKDMHLLWLKDWVRHRDVEVEWKMPKESAAGKRLLREGTGSEAIEKAEGDRALEKCKIWEKRDLRVRNVSMGQTLRSITLSKNGKRTTAGLRTLKGHRTGIRGNREVKQVEEAIKAGRSQAFVDVFRREIHIQVSWIEYRVQGHWQISTRNVGCIA